MREVREFGFYCYSRSFRETDCKMLFVLVGGSGSQEDAVALNVRNNLNNIIIHTI